MSQKSLNQPSTLYVVATPIGNLGDMVPRAIEILQAVDCIAAEDTRHSGKLLAHFGVQTQTVAYHDFSDDSKVQYLLGRLQQGENIALISDAGTPLISDPGYRLVHEARALGIRICPIPGPCALVAALSASGLPSNRFAFEGFPPAKNGARMQWFSRLKAESRTLIFYESTHRIVESLKNLAEVFGADRRLVLAREITKTFETFLDGPVQNVIETLERDSNQQRGEFVIMVEGVPEAEEVDASETQARAMLGIMLEEGLSVKQASSLAAKICGVKKNPLYQHALSLQSAS